MGSKISDINNFIQKRLIEYNQKSVTAVEAAQWLNNAKILKDSDLRPGLPLRRYLRAKKIIGGIQEYNRRWRILRIEDYEKLYSVEDASRITGTSKELIYKSIDNKELNAVRPEEGKRGIYVKESSLKDWSRLRNKEIKKECSNEHNAEIGEQKANENHIIYELKDIRKALMNLIIRLQEIEDKIQ